MAIQKTATVGNRLVLLSAFVHFSQFHQSQPYIKLCNMMNLRFFGENHKNLLTFTGCFCHCTTLNFIFLREPFLFCSGVAIISSEIMPFSENLYENDSCRPNSGGSGKEPYECSNSYRFLQGKYDLHAGGFERRHRDQTCL